MSKTRRHIPSFGPKKQKKGNWLRNHLALKDNQWHDDDWYENCD